MTIDEPEWNLYRTLRVAERDRGVLSVLIDAPPMNLIEPELVRDLLPAEISGVQATCRVAQFSAVSPRLRSGGVPL